MARVLVVEDDPGVRELIESVLLEEGHHVVSTLEGESAFARVVEQQFDMVITDIFMPRMDGLEFIMELSRLARRPRVLAISGGGAYGTHDYLPIARHLGADATLVKPFRTRELVALVQSILRGDDSS